MIILIAEDHADDRKLLRLSLEHYGCEVIEAADGKEGLHLAHKHKPDVIISDALMPKMDGFQFLRAVKTEDELKSIPFIFYTATYVGDQEARLAISLGAEAYIIKPKEPAELWREVKEILESMKTGKEGKLTAELIEEDKEYLKRYSEIVAVKLDEIARELKKEIAEHKQAEKALATSEEKYRLLVNSLQEGIWALDKDENTTFVNNRMAEMLGYTVEEMLGKKVFDFMDERGIKLCKEKIEQRKAGVKEQHDFELIRKDGSTLYVTMVAAPILDDEGNNIGGVAGIIDITERKKMEEALKRREANLSKAEEIAKVGNWEWNILTNELTWSAEVYRLYGLEPLKGKPSYDIVVQTLAPECRDRFITAIDDAVKLGKHFEGEYRIINLDGTEYYTHTIGEVIRDNDGRPVAMFGIVQDITERKKTEEKLHESEERFRLAMLGASDGLWDWDLQTNHVFYSPRWKSMLGYAEEELESHLDTWKRVVHPDDLELSLLLINDYLEGRSDKYELEFRLRHKDGHYLNILSRATLVHGSDGKPLRLVGTHVDITERKKTVEALQDYSTELKKSNRELNDALAKVKQLSGMLPICSYCKKIKDDKGYWDQVDSYITKHTDTLFSHGMCPECAKKAYEEFEKLKKKQT